jgi:hypothetical protein
MRSTRQRLSAAAIAAGLITMVLGLGSGPAGAALPNECSSQKADNAHSLNITTVPAANSDVPAGTSIQVTGHWNSADWREVDRMATCVTSGGQDNPSLSSLAFIVTVGDVVTSVTIPADMQAGTKVCLHDVLIGGAVDGPAKDTSGEVCFHSAAAPVTPTTAAPVTNTTTAPTTTIAPDTDTSGASAGSPATPGELVQGAVTSNPAPAPLGELPRTGSGSAALAGFGGLAVGLGVLSLALGRRRTVRA